MSSEALAWAFKQNIKPSSLKFTLVAMCECANYKTGCIMPSLAHLSEITGQDRKTIIANIDELERRGYIRDTGEKAGRTGQIKVYNPTFGTVPETEPSQKRNGSEIPPKQSQKRDTEPSSEPSSPLDTSDEVSPPSVENDDLTSEEVVEAWNALATDVGLPVVAKLTKERKRKLACRIRDHPFDEWATALAAIRRSRFLQGDNQRGWRANFDFLLQPSSFTKLLEGQYDEQAKAH